MDEAELEISWGFTEKTARIKVVLGDAKVKIVHPIDDPEQATLLVSCLPTALEAALDHMFPSKEEPKADHG